MLYGMKSLGRYHFFKTEEARTAFIKTLPEWEQNHVEAWTTVLPEKKVSA